MNLIFAFLQTPINQLSLLEWLLGSIVLVIIVTLVYVYVLNRSPPPEGYTVAKAEKSVLVNQAAFDPTPALLSASSAISENNLSSAIENSVEAVRLCLSVAMERFVGRPTNGMGISDLAFLVQAKSKSGPQFAEPVYQLNNLRLKAAQNQVVTPEEAQWAVSFANWLAECFQKERIRF